MATKIETTPRKLQLATVIAIGGSFAVQWALTLNTVIQQLQTNSNLSSYTSFFVGQIIVPVVLFAGAYFLNPRKLSLLGKLFEATLLTLIGQIAVGFMVQLAMLIQFSIGFQGVADTALSITTYDLTAVAVGLVLYFAALVYLRRTKCWK